MSRRRQRGGSLLEVLAAMTLFALVASAIGALAHSSITHTTQNRHYTIAAMLAQRELEDLRGLDYPSVVSRSSVATDSGQAYTIGTVVQPGAPVANTSTVTVTVGWLGPEGPKNYVVQTIFTDVTA
jgi:general secretion pathway protein I